MPSTTVTGRKRPGILLWQDLNIEELHKIKESKDKLQTLAGIFGLLNYKSELKSSILLDLYFYTLQFSEKKGFNDEQTSALLSIIKNVHEKAIETPYGNVDDTFKYFKELLLCHSVKRPPFSIQLYSTDQVQMIANYITNTYFKHFKLYKYAFTPKVRLDLTFDYVDIPETPVPDEEDDQPSNEEKFEVSAEVSNTDVRIEQPDTAVIDDSPAIQELKSLITDTLNEQVNQRIRKRSKSWTLDENFVNTTIWQQQISQLYRDITLKTTLEMTDLNRSYLSQFRKHNIVTAKRFRVLSEANSASKGMNMFQSLSEEMRGILDVVIV